MALQDNLKEARRRMGLSQELVAERLGVSRQAVTKWEAGQSKPSARNLQALAELYQTSAEELLASAGQKGPNWVLRTNLTKWAIILQVSFLHAGTQYLYMLGKNPEDEFYRGGILFCCVLMALCSTWMAASHRYEPDPAQRRKNANIELGYCGMQLLLALLTAHFGMGLVGTALAILVLLVYLLYINPKFMNRKFTK